MATRDRKSLEDWVCVVIDDDMRRVSDRNGSISGGDDRTLVRNDRRWLFQTVSARGPLARTGVFRFSTPRQAIAAMTEFIGAPDLTPERLARPGKVLMFGVPPTRIDVLSSIDGCSFAKAWPRRVESRYGRQKVWFLGLNDLIRAKKAAGRDQDRIDVERLLRAKRRRREGRGSAPSWRARSG